MRSSLSKEMDKGEVIDKRAGRVVRLDMTRMRVFYFTGIDQPPIRMYSCQFASVNWEAGLF